MVTQGHILRNLIDQTCTNEQRNYLGNTEWLINSGPKVILVRGRRNHLFKINIGFLLYFYQNAVHQKFSKKTQN